MMKKLQELYYEIVYRNWWSPTNILSEIKWAYQRVIRGYDDRIFWEFDSYFNQFIPAIEEFCHHELAEEYMHLNPEKTKILNTMLRLIKNYKDMNDGYDDFYEHPNTESKLWSHFGKHIGWFWN